MSRLVKFGGKIYPRYLFEATGSDPRDCPQCGGLGVVPEQLDDDRIDEMVPCPTCKMWCKRCKRSVPKSHVCEQGGQGVSR